MVWSRWHPSQALGESITVIMLGGFAFGENCTFRAYMFLLFRSAGFVVSGWRAIILVGEK